jgi:glycosyltransferase involved in cell wall biosynthesis
LSEAKAAFAVVHVCEALGGGLLEVLPPLANGSAAQGIPTILLYGRRPQTPEDVAAVFDPRVVVQEVPGWGSRSPLGALTSTLRAARALRRTTARYERGAVHLHSSFAGVAGRLLPLGRGWRVFYSPQAYGFLNESLPRSVRALSRSSEWLLGRRGETMAVSEFEGEVARRLVGAKRVVVVRNGVEETAVPPPGPDVPFTVAVVGRISFQKRPDLVAETARSLGPDWPGRFVWIGDGDGREELLAAGIEVTGWQTPDQVRKQIAEAHVVLHLAEFEGFPLAVLQAMAWERAIVASDLPPIREAIGDAGILVRSTEDAAAALQRLSRDEEYRRRLAREARERVLRLFTREQMVRGASEAYGLASDG